MLRNGGGEFLKEEIASLRLEVRELVRVWCTKLNRVHQKFMSTRNLMNMNFFGNRVFADVIC